MDSQLEPVRQDIRNVQERIVKYEQKLAAAEQAGNKEEEKSLLDLLRSLQEKENILLPSKPCLQLVHTGLPVLTACCIKIRCTKSSDTYIVAFNCDAMELCTCRVLTWRLGCTSRSQKMG